MQVTLNISPETKRKLNRVKRERHWPFKAMIDIWATREIAELENEKRTQPTNTNATAPCGAIQTNSCE